VHKAPRILNVGACSSDIISGCSRSIVAGCQQSVSWARGLLHNLVEGLGYIMPGSICFEHFDDLSHVLACKSKRVLYDAAIKVGKAVDQGMRKLDLFLADKSCIVSNCSLGKVVADELFKEGIPISYKKASDDLGLEVAAGTRRCAKTQLKRIGKGLWRSKGVRVLSKFTRKAHKLISTGIGPQQSYGHASQGASPDMVRRMRKNYKDATHLGGTRACTTTLLAWYLGKWKDPSISIRAEQVATWIDIWRSADAALQDRLRTMWKRMVPTLGLHPR
jgi:hypothetical protein